MTARSQSLSGRALAALATPDPRKKAAAVRALAHDWRAGSITAIGRAAPIDRPARPERPALRPPREVPKRKISKAPEGRIALLHALAHIELNAIDLACDIIARFADGDLPRAFYDDWVRVADEEAKHYLLLDRRLADLGAAYGDLPAHDGLWQSAEATAGDLLARLAVVPLVLEARGLDVTPQMISKLEAVGDGESAAALGIIYEDEKGHVAIGKRWFDWLCTRRGLEPTHTWRDLVRRHFKGQVKPPFNEEARRAAGLQPSFYENLEGEAAN